MIITRIPSDRLGRDLVEILPLDLPELSITIRDRNSRSWGKTWESGIGKRLGNPKKHKHCHSSKTWWKLFPWTHRSFLNPPGNKIAEGTIVLSYHSTSLIFGQSVIFDIKLRHTDLGIRPLGDLMMLNPILRSKTTPGRCEMSKIRKTIPSMLEKHRKVILNAFCSI